MTQAEFQLNKLLGIEQTNFEITDIKNREHEVIFYLRHKDDAKYICTSCGALNTHCHSKRWITLNDMPWGNKKIKWQVERATILCGCSYHHRVEYLPFRSENHHYITRRLEEHVEGLLCGHMFTVMDVAKMLGLGYELVYKIDHDVLRRLLQNMEIPDPVNISVDEKSFKKKHSYVTVVTDADTSNVIWVSTGNRKESLDEFFKILGPDRCKKIKTVSKDLHRPYAVSCNEYVPQALQVADKFHVVKRLTQAAEEARKELLLSNEVKKSEKKVIKSMNWVIRHKEENMNKKTYKGLTQLKKTNEPLYEAYLLKESFFEFFNFTTIELGQAKMFLMKWCKDAESTIFESFKSIASYVQRNMSVLLNIIKEKRTSAISEGINKKISVIKSMAYGYRSIDYFKLKILQRCGVLGAYWTPESKKTPTTT